MRCQQCQQEWPDRFKFCPQRGLPFVAVQAGDGSAAASDRAIALAGSDNIAVSGSVLGSIYKVYLTPPGPRNLSKTEFERLLGEYLRWVCDAYSKARLYGLESVPTVRGSAPIRQLADVFVPLTLCRTRSPRKAELERLAGQGAKAEDMARAWLRLAGREPQDAEQLPLGQLLAAGRRLAIVGGAGSGKSTVLAYLAAGLAAAARSGQPPPFSLPVGEQLPVPVLVPLRYYRDYLEMCRQSPQQRLSHPRHGTLPGFIPWYLQHRSSVLEFSEDFFDRLLRGGGCLLMLDGLDEVVSREERGRVRQEVEYLVRDVYPGNQVIVTAREAGYRADAVFGDDFDRLDVQRLDSGQIRTLVQNWCRQLYPDQVAGRTDALVDAIDDINSLRAGRDLPPLISTPCLAA